MNVPLYLTITDYKDEAHWRWALTDDKGNFIGDHEVALDANAPEYRGFKDLPKYLQDYTPAQTEEQLLRELGEWMGVHVFGGVADALRERMAYPVTVVKVSVPPEAQTPLLRPFELAHLDGQPLVERGVRFVYQSRSPAAKRAGEGKGVEESLRVLAVFSLPDEASPLNLRRERYLLKRLLEQIAQTHGTAIELRILQYGATRRTLEDALAEGRGWDVIHFSGHGLEGQLVLEDECGQADLIQADKLAPLLRPTKSRLKLLTLSACLSGAGTLQAARAQLGLDALPTRPAGQVSNLPYILPSLAQQLADELDCAVLAMRYPVGDEFLINLMLPLYGLLLERGQALPGALKMALDKALAPDRRDVTPPLSLVTPILFGPRAADLRLAPPKRPPSFQLPATGLFNFPPEPERFVGRLLPMLRASQALAPEGDMRGVLFYGMAGGGKTTCALELAYRHERDRFVGYVWHKAPDEGHDITSALANFLQDVEAQLDLRDLALTAHVDDPVAFEKRTLPRLKAMLAQNAVLIVIDNLESLLTESGQWRDPKWGQLVEALLGHTGASRLVLTSRRLPAGLQAHPALLREAIHALSLGEAVLLARELPGLRRLFRDQPGRALLARALDVIQGHPKLLDLADRQAADPAALARQLEAAPVAVQAGTFFTTGESAQTVEGFTATLHRWTAGLAAMLPSTARLLFHFLCCLEEPDRRSDIIQANWEDFLKRLSETSEVFQTSEVSDGLEASLNRLITTGLVESWAIRPASAAGEQIRNQKSAIQNLQSFRLHSAVAEAGRAEAGPAALDAADIELGNFWIARWQQGMNTELQGGGPLIVQAGRRAAPYLMRAKRWEDAARLLERVIQRDTTPATLAMALPLLRQIASAAQGTHRELIDAGTLADALLKAGRYDEAEQMQRDLIDKCVAQGNYRLASNRAGNLLELFMKTAPPQNALAVVGQEAEFIRRAQLGPWTQLANEIHRLQILNAMGHYQEVLDAVQNLRGQLAALPEKSQAEETAIAWSVRETLLNIGARAAMGLEQWEATLDFNAEILWFMQQRGADEVGLASMRFNNHGPLLSLRRFREARELLESCRAVFEQAHDILYLGKVFGALANLEDEEGHDAAAVQFEQVGLSYSYQAGQPEGCATGHNSLANYLERAPADPKDPRALAHRLAAGIIWLQIDSGNLAINIGKLAKSDVPVALPTFEQVVATVEQIEGVRFRDMFARVPTCAPDGDAAIAAVWQMAQEEQERRRTKGCAGVPAACYPGRV